MSRTTIWNILNNSVENYSFKRGILIPMIQRDYAQGRDNEKANEIRTVFLNKILDGIKDVIERNNDPMELDFVYGYIETESFIPLDGQQRLTTLYLLHWYFAFKEQLLDTYKLPLSRFTYQTRKSSEEFLKKINEGLTCDDHYEIFQNKGSFRSAITNKNWHFVDWNYDLTIQSALTMLDEIHIIFNIANFQLADLINEKKPCITFNFLNIENFGLTDDLYIKMNARGKPLTKFEELKAELGRFIKLSDFNDKYNFTLKHSAGSKPVNVETYFITKIDTSWSDYFWNIRNKETNEFDDKLLNLLAFISLNEIVKDDIVQFELCLAELDKKESKLSYYKFQTLKLLNESSIIAYIKILDVLVSKDETISNYFIDESHLNKKSIIASTNEKNFKARYEERVLFYAVSKFLTQNQTILNAEELLKYDRLIRNLVSNTIYNNAKDFHASILSIDSILESYTGDIYQTFLSGDIKGFDSQQITEEKLKLELFRKSNDWIEFILEAESHPYLNGQIIFILSFTNIYDLFIDGNIDWNKKEEDIHLENCKILFEKFKNIFDEKGLRSFKKELFRRSLLVKGDYSLYSTNFSFLINNHRDISWKRLLKETGNRSKSNQHFKAGVGFLKELFEDVIVNNIEDSLQKIIKNHQCTDWRKDFIDNPILLELAGEKYIKYFDEDHIYVLRKKKYNKYEDPEIKSVLLKEKLMKKGFSNVEIELGYIDTLNQYGIIRVKNLKPKIVYNHDGEKNYLIKQKGKEDFYSKSQNQIVNYIVENFF